MKSDFWRQLFAISPVYMLQLNYGMSSGYPAITTPQLTMDCALFPITDDEESWIVSLENVISPFVCILSGFLQQKIGPKTTLIVTCLPYFLGWVCAVLSGLFKNLILLYLSRLLVGAGHGLLTTTIYTVEIVSRDLRGSFSVFEGVTRSVGMIIMYICGAFLPWYQTAYVGMIFPLIAAILLLNSPESPVFLVSKGKIDEAENTIRKVKPEQDIPSKIKEILDGLDKFKENSLKSGSKIHLIKKIHQHPEIYKPFLIVTFLSLIQQFSGATVIRGYVVKIFGEVFDREHKSLLNENLSALCECECSHGSPLSQSAYFSAILIGVIRLTASLSLTYLLVLFKRRNLYLTSACGTIISLATFSTILLLSDHLADWDFGISQNVLTWCSLVSACCLVFSVNLGVQPMPLLMSSELYPSDIRAFCKSVSRSITCVLIVITLKVFPILEKSLHLSGSFYLYCGVVLFGLPIVMIILPETKDLSIAEINSLFKKKNKESS